MRSKESIGTLEIYTHGVRILGVDDRVKVAARRVLNNWVVKGERKVENFRGDLVTEEFVAQLYGANFANQNDFWLHKGQMKEFETELQVMGLHPDDFVIKVIPVHTPEKVEFKLKKGRVLRDYQLSAREFALSPVKEGDHFSKLIAMPTGTGKALADSTPVQTTNGWVKIGKLRPGDEVISKDGKPVTVLGVYPQGIVPLLELTFSDKRTIKASYDHLWTVHSHDWKNTGGWKTIQSHEVKKYVETKQNKVSIPLLDHPDVPDVELSVDPYLLGILLGDGSFARMRQSRRIRFCKGDSEYFDKVFSEKLEAPLYARKSDEFHWDICSSDKSEHPLIDKLEDLGYHDDIRSIDKFIPHEYMKSSRYQKIELLRGLFDTDGSTSGNGGAIAFTSSSEKMAKQVRELVWSIGGQCKLKDYLPVYDHDGEKKVGSRAWTLSIRHRDPRELLAMPRKISGIPEDYKYKDILRNRIESVRHIGSDYATCIEVDSDDGLFIAGDYLVTHNTVTACGTAADLGQRWIVAVLPRYAKKWCQDLDDNLDVGPKGIMLVEKTTQLRGLIDLCKTAGTKKLPPTIVITLSTLRTFYDLYREDAEACVEDMGCAPWELGRILNAGMLTIDEAHEHINTVFLTAMYLHGLKFVSLSGTMRTEDVFQERVQNVIFPQIKRYTDVKMKRYIDVEFISYSFEKTLLPRIRYQAFGRTDYNHPTFEASIMKIPVVLAGYLNIITDLLDFDYIPRRADRRALVFVGTVELADKVVARLNSKYPHLKIARYCAAQGDKYSDLLEADITVSTLQSSGTAVDIPMLISVVCTTLVNSSKTNIQALGRLRELPDGEKVTMYMPYCRQNPKHLKYMAFRYELFKDITKSIKTFNYDTVLGRM